jgi:hypothetical protein
MDRAYDTHTRARLKLGPVDTQSGWARSCVTVPPHSHGCGIGRHGGVQRAEGSK